MSLIIILPHSPISEWLTTSFHWSVSLEIVA